MFKLDNDASIGGTGLMGTIYLIPAHLIIRFGEPVDSDGYKVSGEYIFTDDKGNVFTLYDYKATTLYGSELLRPSELWELTVPFEFHISSKPGTDITAFKTWLVEELKSLHQTTDTYEFNLERLTAFLMTNAEIDISADFEITDFIGNCSAVDPVTDSAAEQWIKEQMELDNVWAWCQIALTASYKGVKETDYLGCCQYLSKEDFLRCPTYLDMKVVAVTKLAEKMFAIKTELDNLLGE